MLRFAISPTADMNIGDLRIALFNHIVSKQKNENLIIKIENIDKEKNIEGRDIEILDILKLFDIEYSQVIYQAENIRFYSAMALQLIHDKKAFSCFCSDKWLDSKKEEAKANKKLYRYDDACANLPAELVIDNLNPFTVRIKKPVSNDVDSFIIMKQDKTPTYNFACAVDDMLNDISVVIHNETSINNVLKQEHIRTSLNYDKKIKYINVPILSNENVNIKWLLKEGFLPEAISNYLISIGNKPPKEIFSVKEAIEWFNIDDISKSIACFDIAILRDINNKHLKLLDTKELSRYVGFADAEIGELAKIYLEEVSTTKELRAKIEPIFAQKNIPNAFKEQSAIIHRIVMDAPYFEKYSDFESYIIKKSGLTGENFSKSLRIILTGVEHGPDIARIYKYLKNYIGEIVK